jgi:diguanylate cyclase
MAGRAPTAARVFVALGAALTLLYSFGASASLNAVVISTVAVCSCVALLAGPRWHRAALRRPWHLVASAAVLFLVGLVVRPWAAGQPGVAAGTADLFTLTGYALLITGLAVMLRRRGSLERHAVTDGVIVCLGMGLLSTVYLAVPAMQIHNRPEWISLLAGLYPLIDVVLLLLLLNLGFSTATRLTSFRLMAVAMSALLLGDLGYAWIGAHGRLTGPPLLDLPFLITYTCFGAAALHPSMTGFATIVARPVQAWSPPRRSRCR